MSHYLEKRLIVKKILWIKNEIVYGFVNDNLDELAFEKVNEELNLVVKLTCICWLEMHDDPQEKKWSKYFTWVKCYYNATQSIATANVPTASNTTRPMRNIQRQLLSHHLLKQGALMNKKLSLILAI